MGRLKPGIYTPLVTPFQDENVDYKSLINNIRILNKTELSGYVLLGSTGEAPLLNRNERLNIIDESVSELREFGKNLIIGVMEESTGGAIQFIDQTSKYHPDAYLVLPPTYFKPIIDDKVIENYYSEISKSTSAPLLLYNVPVFSGVNIDSKLIISLAKTESIKGWKDSSSDMERFKTVCLNTDGKFQNFIGNANNLRTGFSYNSAGAILAITNAIPTLCLELYNAHIAGKDDETERIQSKIDKFVEKIIKPYGIAGLKRAMDLLGFNGGDVRKPYQLLDDEAAQPMRQFLDSDGYI